MHLSKNENGYWEARVKCPDGKRKTFSTHRKNRVQAQEMISKSKILELEKAAELGILTPNVIAVLAGGRRTTIEQTIPLWKEWLSHQRHSQNSINNAEMWLRAWTESDPMKQSRSRTALMAITEKHIDPWINNPESTTKLSSRKVMLSAVRSFFSFVSGRGWCVGNPAALVRVDPGILGHEQKEVYRQPVFTEDEMDSLSFLTAPEGECPSVFWHAAVSISRYTGLRLGDIASLEWSCLSAPGKIAVWTMKRDRRVELPLAPERLLDVVQSIARDHSVFVFPEQREIIQDPKRRALLSNQFGKLCRRCSILGKSFHGLRATAATEMARNGVSVEDIAAILGHASTETTCGYIRP